MYIFNPPAIANEMPLTFESASAFITKGRNKYSRKLGTTLALEFYTDNTITVKLYETTIAYIAADYVYIFQAVNDHGSQATTWWIQKVLTDNGIGGPVFREAGKYSQAGKTFNLNGAAS